MQELYFTYEGDEPQREEVELENLYEVVGNEAPSPQVPNVHKKEPKGEICE